MQMMVEFCLDLIKSFFKCHARQLAVMYMVYIYVYTGIVLEQKQHTYQHSSLELNEPFNSVKFVLYFDFCYQLSPTCNLLTILKKLFVG